MATASELDLDRRREAAPSVGTAQPTEEPAQPEPAIRVFVRRELLWLVCAVPILTTAALVAFGFFQGDPMLASGLAAVVVGFVVFLLFAARIPQVFALVRLRGLVPAEHVPAYRAYELRIERDLNSWWSLVLAAAGAVIGLARYPVAVGFDELLSSGPRGVATFGPIALADMLGEALIGAAAGLAIWRMIVVGVKVHGLGRFPLRVQLGHPDRCGGFQPLGDLCLWNALILTVPGVFLGWWILVGPSSQYGTTYVALHSVLAGIVVILASVAFLLPLWSVHRAMVRSASGLRDDIERQGQRIDQLARELVAAGEGPTAADWDAKAKDLERRQALYRANERIPSWPVDVRLATKFASSQAVPLLGLTGLGKPVVDAVKALTSFIDTSAG